MSMIGKTLAHYEITAPIGRGGMGEVFKAKDGKLARDVAIKVLPEEFARDADRVARFQREAKLLASLNHPNIAAIYGLEESAGTNFLVLELVDGDTLADRIKAGPVPVEESLKLALQIAEALEAAHEKGVIHRDLKPANIKVTPDGKVKVLDFGLAKAFAGEQAELNLSNSPTLSDMATQQGVILGTAAYMSPEQARGRSVDKRADIWAFGCVLYEMLTGRAAFSGKDVTDILAAVIRAEPEWNNLPANLHWRLREVIERCLQKDAKDRYHDISDVKVDIQRVLVDPSGLLVQPVAGMQPQIKLRRMLPWAIAAVFFCIIVAGIAFWSMRKPEPRHVSRFYCEMPEEHMTNTETTSPLSAVSPDGKKFVYCTNQGLYLRSIEELDAKLIPGTNGRPADPFFSPDGQWVGYWSTADNQLKKISVNGGAPVTLTNTDNPGGPIWYTDGTIVYGSSSKGIMRVSANGGAPETLIPSKGGETLITPQILPDGKSVLFTLYRQGGDFQIVVQSLKSGERKEVLKGGCANKYLSTGHLIYVVGGNLFAVPFDVGRLEVTGGPVPLVEGIYRENIRAPQFAVSESGTLVYFPGTRGAAEGVAIQRTLVWLDRKGKEQLIAAQPNNYHSPHISPDGTKVALSVNAGNNKEDIWIWDLVRQTMTRLTFNEASSNPLWTLDGKRVAFSTGSNADSVYWKAADGTGADEKLGSVPDRAVFPASWSSDSKILVSTELSAATNFDIGSLSLEGDHKGRPLLQEKYMEIQPNISPDGRWMAYSSNESGKLEVYVRSFPDVNKGRWQISTSGGDTLLWAPNGRELFYRNGDSVMAVAVEAEQNFQCGKPETLFRGTYTSLNLQDGHSWDISHDGKRFLMMKEPGTTASAGGSPHKINIVLNWTEELKQRVPGK